MGRGYGKVLTVILIIIIVAVVGLLSYLGYNYYSNYRINQDSAKAVDTFTEEVTSENPVGGSTGNITDLNVLENITTIPEGNIVTNTTTTTNAKKRTYKGFNMLGTIEISKTSLRYPVLDKVTKKSLETSVAVVYPFESVALNKVGNVVIVGHNYRNGLFFSNNKKLSNGDKINITDLEGKKVTYVIYKIFETSENDTKFYNRDTKGKREITLSTCTDDSKARLIIQAREE